MSIGFNSIKTVFSMMTLKNILTIVTINSVCALLKALYLVYYFDSNFDNFYTSFLGYFQAFNVFGFSLIFSYLLLSLGPEKQMPIFRVTLVGLLAIIISIPFVYFLFEGVNNTFSPIVDAFIYSASQLLFSVWAILLVLYVQKREILPRFQMLKKEVKEHSAERQRAEMELQLLQAQIEPHFFFNTLASLHGLIDIAPEKAQILLEELTEYLRSTVPLFRKKYVTLEEEQEMIKRYLNIQRIRFSGRFDFEVNIPKVHYQYLILPMSLLTLVENAIKHGVEKKDGSGQITVSSEVLGNGRLTTTVIDNIGLYNDKSQGTGLSNLKARIGLTYGDKASFSIEATNSGKTVAMLEIPINDE
ncbi:MAG: histidine kinase [Colwellia sp.]|nr:histidine kinase [Colwellia sp.]